MAKRGMRKAWRHIAAAADAVRAVQCVHCGAGRGERCWNNPHGRQVVGVHWQRRRDFDRKRGRRAAQRGEVDVRFVCPVCGGAHSRAQHDPEAAT